MTDIERELDFYRQQCNDLGARLVQLLQEQTRMRREARRSAVVARLIREAFPLGSLEIHADEIIRKFLQIVLTAVHVDTAMVLEYLPQNQTITVREVLGGPGGKKSLHLPADCVKEFHFANAGSTSDPLTESLRQISGVPFFLWGYNPPTGIALLLGNRTEDQHLHQPFDLKDSTIIEGALNVFVRVTEHRYAAEEMRENENYLKTILKSIQTGILVIDAETHQILYANHIACRLIGAQTEKVIGAVCHKYICPAERGRCPITDLCQVVDNSERILLDLTGRRIPIIKSVVPLTLHGRMALLESFVDITERKFMEEELKKAKESAESSSLSKSQFLANMSHEIRTPLNGVLGMTDLLLNTELKETQRRFADNIRLSGENLLHLINDILDFSKIEAGKLELDFVDFDLLEMVEELTETIAVKAHGKGLEVATLVHHDVPRCLRGDPARLRQILLNLLGNAVKFTYRGEVVVRVFKSLEEPQTILVRFEVSDTGIGIEPDDQHRIFEVFSQVDGSVSRHFGGTGLGLAIAKQLTEMMGGQIGLESNPGVGSTFWFTVRLEKTSAGDESAKPLSDTLIDRRLLIVGDGDINCTVIRYHVSNWGVRADTVNDAVQALTMLTQAERQAKPYHSVIFDSKGVLNDGIRIAKMIKNDPRIADVALLLLSPLVPDPVVEKALETGYFVSVTKPVRQSTLLDYLVATAERASFSRACSALTVGGNGEGKEFRGHVLLAEDNPVNQEIVREMLGNFGCIVDVVTNGKEALEIVFHHPYDLVLMDCQMPGMDGYEATKRIREMEASTGINGSAPECTSRRIPIIALTAHAMKGDREKCIAAGMDDYMTKPFSQKQLRDILSRWLSERKGAAMESEGNDKNEIREDSNPPKEEGTDGNANEKMADTGHPIDRKALEQIAALKPKGTTDILHQVISIYFSSSMDLLRKMKEALPAGDVRVLHRAAHSLKSSSANLGALALSGLCAELETMCRMERMEGAPVLAEAIEDEYARVRAALEMELTSRAGI